MDYSIKINEFEGPLDLLLHLIKQSNIDIYDIKIEEIIDKQKLVGVISMPNGIFRAPTKKGSASKGATIKTSFLI